MSRSLLLSLLLTGLCVGLLPGQNPPPPGPGGPRGFGPRAGGGPGGPLSERRLARQLNLTAEQQNTIHTAMEESRVMQQGMAQKEGTLRTQLAAAVKAGNESQIDSISQDLAQLHQQRTAVQAKALAKVYGSLTADQKATVDTELSRAVGAPLPRGQRPRRGPQGTTPAPAPQQQ